MMLTFGLLLALASAFATNVGFLLRHRGAVAAPDVDLSRPLHSAAELFRSRWWTIGFLVALVAYGLHVGALALASLSLVQAVLAGGLALLAVIAERGFGVDLGPREWAGVGLAAAGLAFLALTGGGPQGEDSAGYSTPAMIAFESALVGIGALLIAWHHAERTRARHGLMLGVSAGLLFTVTHVAVKALTGLVDDGIRTALLSPYPLVAAIGAVVAFFASARSLQLGDAVAVIALTSIASNASAIPAGIVVFGDPLGDNALSIAARSAAFVLVVVAAALIPGPIRAAGHAGQRPVTSSP